METKFLGIDNWWQENWASLVLSYCTVRDVLRQRRVRKSSKRRVDSLIAHVPWLQECVQSDLPACLPHKLLSVAPVDVGGSAPLRLVQLTTFDDSRFVHLLFTPQARAAFESGTITIQNCCMFTDKRFLHLFFSADALSGINNGTFGVEQIVHYRDKRFLDDFISTRCQSVITEGLLSADQVTRISGRVLGSVLSEHGVASLREGLITGADILAMSEHDDRILYCLFTANGLSYLRDERPTLQEIIAAAFHRY